MLLLLTQKLQVALVRSAPGSAASSCCLLDYPIPALRRPRLGIIGIDRRFRPRRRTAATAFGMEVLVANRPGGAAVPGRLDLDELLATVDVLSLHCRFAPATQGMINASATSHEARCCPVLINTTRTQRPRV